MVTVWDLYLDANDASRVLTAFATLEAQRAVREPLPMSDAVALLGRLQTIGGVAEEDAVYWRREAEDRSEEVHGGGGRWGDPAVARTMVATATGLADGASSIAAAALEAAADLAARLDQWAARRGTDTDGVPAS